jgi:transcriptional regulator with XRE-family HTH domain
MIKAQQYETNLRELIEENGYTFKEVSEETGFSLSALFIYARGERSIPHSPYIAAFNNRIGERNQLLSDSE